MTDNSDKSRVKPSELHLHEGTFAADSLLAGKFRVISLLGSGGMGTVYRVQQVFLNKAFALKTLDSGTVSDVMLRRFQVEGKAASSLSHPNLVQVHDFGLLENGNPYLVMDLVDGITLAELINTGGPMPWHEVAPLFAQVCFGLAYAHDQGVVHRDIKPSNIMIANGLPMGAEGSVKIVDFGIAKLTSSDDGVVQTLTRTGEIFGSPLYMSPEQCSGGEVDRRTDIYALGCVLFEALTGTPPHVGANSLATMMLHQSQPAPTLKEASLGRDFPAALEQVVQKMLRKLPAERYQNLAQVAHDLSSACAGGAANFAAAESSSTKPKPVVLWSANRFYLLLALSVLVTAGIAGLGGYLFAPKHQNKQHAHDISLERMPGLDDYSVQETRNIAILAKAQPIRSTLVTTDGQQQRKFIFPDCGIGSLTQCDYSKPYNLGFGQHKFEKAKGTVWVTANVPLMLELQFTDYPGTLETLSIVDKIDPEEFCGLALTGGPVMPEESPTKNMAQMLKTASRWTNINSVELHNLAEDKEVFAALETMKGLRNLVLAMPDLSSVDLGQSPFLGRLETLMLSDFGNSDVADLIPGLAGSLNLKQLSLNNTPVSAASILELSKCPNLNYLEIGGQPIDDELVQAIAQLHSLRVVVFKESLTREQILMLTRCPWLRGIKLAKESYTRPIQKSLERLDARIEFFSRLPQSADKERLPSAKRGL